VFGNDEFFVIAVKSDDLFSKPRLEIIREITEKLEGLEDAEKVLSIANVDDIIGGPDFFEVRPFLDEIPENTQALALIKKTATENRLSFSASI
jgi:predicted RND superfamily exporter protein